jgi:hypothetical protein
MMLAGATRHMSVAYPKSAYPPGDGSGAAEGGNWPHRCRHTVGGSDGVDRPRPTTPHYSTDQELVANDD